MNAYAPGAHNYFHLLFGVKRHSKTGAVDTALSKCKVLAILFLSHPLPVKASSDDPEAAYEAVSI